jgi:hypothetical protein
MRASDISRGLLPLAIVAFVVIIGVSTTGGGSRGLPTAAAFPSASGRAAVLEASAPSPFEPSAEPPAMPEPTPEATWPPAPAVEPAPNDDLALAGRDGVPGRLYCSNWRTFGFEDLDNPTGAEAGIGPEHDVLRSVIGNTPSREVTRDEVGVTFLADRRDTGPWEHGPYLVVDVNRDGDSWRSAGYGDCEPRAWGPPGYGAATWELDPAFRKPRASDRVLHLLVHELACSSGNSPHGRIGPAYVISDPFHIRIELIVRHRPGGQDCPGAEVAPASLRLPEPLDDRTLKDMNAHIRTGAGG